MPFLLTCLLLLAGRPAAASDELLWSYVPSLFFGDRAVTDSSPLARGPRAGEQAILRVQRSGRDLALYRCIAKTLSAEAVDQSRCDYVTEVNAATVERALGAMGAGQSLSKLEVDSLASFALVGELVVGAPLVWSLLTAPEWFAARKGLITLGLGTMTATMALGALLGYLRIDSWRQRAAEALTNLLQTVEAKLPDEHEYVRPISPGQWAAFAPSRFARPREP